MRGRISFSEYEDVLSLDALSDSGEDKTTLYSKPKLTAPGILVERMLHIQRER